MEDQRWDRHRERSWYWDEYPDSPPTWADRFERLLVHLVVLGLVALVLVQALLTQPQLRRMLVVLERLEGVPVARPSLPDRPVDAPAGRPADSGRGNLPTAPMRPAARQSQEQHEGGQSIRPASAPIPAARITVALINQSSSPGARLLVGGRVVADFASGKAAARVVAGQSVVVDGSGVPEELVFRVVEAEGFLFDALGQQVRTRGSRQVLVPAKHP